MILAPTLTLNAARLAASAFNAVIVSGAGYEPVNGVYILGGEYNGKPFYELTQDGPTENAISWNGSEWDLLEGGEPKYLSTDNTEFPWEAEWQVGTEDLPLPILTPTNV
jgi:hypothetical protein